MNITVIFFFFYIIIHLFYTLHVIFSKNFKDIIFINLNIYYSNFIF